MTTCSLFVVGRESLLLINSGVVSNSCVFLCLEVTPLLGVRSGGKLVRLSQRTRYNGRCTRSPARRYNGHGYRCTLSLALRYNGETEPLYTSSRLRGTTESDTFPPRKIDWS